MISGGHVGQGRSKKIPDQYFVNKINWLHRSNRLIGQEVRKFNKINRLQGG